MSTEQTTVGTSRRRVSSALRRGRHHAGVAKLLVDKYGITGAARVAYHDLWFDVRHGVDTNLPVAKADLFEDDRIDLQNRYVPSTFGLVDQMIDIAARYVDVESSNFVDLGSGKGKVLIGAARRPFRAVKGIEYAEPLHDVAVRNIERLGLGDRVEVIHADATTYEWEPDDRVLYFFNPFMGPLLDRCLANLAAADNGGVPRVYLYANPVDDEIFGRYFEKLGDEVLQPGGVHVTYYRDRTGEA